MEITNCDVQIRQAGSAASTNGIHRSKRAVEVNIAIMRTFVQLRRLMDGNRELARNINTLEKKYDEEFATVFKAIKQLLASDDMSKQQPKLKIGFHAGSPSE
jgi:hypothetical protein